MNNFFNYASIIAYTIFTIGIIFQIRKTLQLKSSRDIAIAEIILRVTASTLLLVKLISTHDIFLIIGQTTLVCALIVDTTLILIYNKPFKKRKSQI